VNAADVNATAEKVAAKGPTDEVGKTGIFPIFPNLKRTDAR
jgi:hypothetical protein